MQERSQQDLNRTWQKINNLDLSMVIKKMARDRGWRLKHAQEAAAQYRRLLFVWYKYKNTYPILPPSQDIDEFWHNHILDTRQYPKDCDAIFGEFIHHNPYTGSLVGDSESAMIDGFEQTQNLYHQEFGEYIYEIRPLYWQRLRQHANQLLSRLFQPVLKILAKFKQKHTPQDSPLSYPLSLR
ncbi:MAG: glycine-rich domain-containing protein [Gammaproteobacteria bacterium]